jgi:hypothetical protein
MAQHKDIMLFILIVTSSSLEFGVSKFGSVGLSASSPVLDSRIFWKFLGSSEWMRDGDANETVT